MSRPLSTGEIVARVDDLHPALRHLFRHGQVHVHGNLHEGGDQLRLRGNCHEKVLIPQQGAGDGEDVVQVDDDRLGPAVVSDCLFDGRVAPGRAGVGRDVAAVSSREWMGAAASIP